MSDVIQFELPNQDEEVVSSADFAGKRLIMFFYPAAMTSGCTLEACDFRDNYEQFRDAGYEVVGVSPDPPRRNKKFQDKEGLTFDLLSDEDHVLSERLGAWGEKTLYGRLGVGLIRSTYVLGPEGELEREWRGFRAKGHVAEVAAELLG